jgi:hypothetical protein
MDPSRPSNHTAASCHLLALVSFDRSRVAHHSQARSIGNDVEANRPRTLSLSIGLGVLKSGPEIRILDSVELSAIEAGQGGNPIEDQRCNFTGDAGCISFVQACGAPGAQCWGCTQAGAEIATCESDPGELCWDDASPTINCGKRKLGTCTVIESEQGFTIGCIYTGAEGANCNDGSLEHDCRGD